MNRIYFACLCVQGASIFAFKPKVQTERRSPVPPVFSQKKHTYRRSTSSCLCGSVLCPAACTQFQSTQIYTNYHFKINNQLLSSPRDEHEQWVQMFQNTLSLQCNGTFNRIYTHTQRMTSYILRDCFRASSMLIVTRSHCQLRKFLQSDTIRFTAEKKQNEDEGADGGGVYGRPVELDYIQLVIRPSEKKKKKRTSFSEIGTHDEEQDYQRLTRCAHRYQWLCRG
ncbi:hypothetical protein GQR58_025479 [Nymphon striatum]|nr:hypothetical protein GQR58_025479 [Nymphon striatum]